MSRPVIGIVANFYDKGPGLPHSRLNVGYSDAVMRAGGLPVVLPPIEDRPAIEQFLDRVDGVLFGGGYDVDPRRYGQDAHPKTILLAGRLEPFVFTVFELADRRAALPALGICLGVQVFNVARGGTLHQHLPEVPRDNPVAHFAPERQYVGGREAHPVRIEPGSRLAAAIDGPSPAVAGFGRAGGAAQIGVNSGHHQAADRLGRGLAATARSFDGIIEAVEDPSRPFFLAVQWHPEEMFEKPEHLALFKTLVKAADDST